MLRKTSGPGASQKTSSPTVKSAPPKVNHYPASVESASYSAGSGTPRPDGAFSGPRIFVRATKQYLDLEVKTNVKINEAQRRIVVTFDTFSKNAVHSMAAVRPQDFEVRLDRLPANTGAYTLVVQNEAGKELFKTTVQHYLPV
jgi:hypothetical protein